MAGARGIGSTIVLALGIAVAAQDYNRGCKRGLCSSWIGSLWLSSWRLVSRV